MSNYDVEDDDDMPIPDDSGQAAGPTDFDDNDKKIISLYEIINELIEECKSRTQDLLYLSQSGDDDGIDAVTLMERIEERNDTSLQQMFQELELKEKKTDNENSNQNNNNNEDDDDDDEDETDQGWEIYNTVVENLNKYMEIYADSMQKIKELKQQINSLGNPTDNEITELELVIEEQTTALEETMLKNDELEKALTNVLTEYSNKINMSNDEIANLHAKLSQQNSEHQQQLRELRAMYETKINELQSNNEDEYKEEVRKLLDTLVSSRGDFRIQVDSLTNEMSQTQRIHHRKIMKLMSEKQGLEDEATKYEKLYKEVASEREAVLDKVIDSLDCIRGDLEVDDEEEYFYLKKTTHSHHGSSTDRQSRLKQRSYHKDRANNTSDLGNYTNRNYTSNNNNNNNINNTHNSNSYYQTDNTNSNNNNTNRSHSSRSHYSSPNNSNTIDNINNTRSNHTKQNRNESYNSNSLMQYTNGASSQNNTHHNHSSSRSKQTRSTSPGPHTNSQYSTQQQHIQSQSNQVPPAQQNQAQQQSPYQSNYGSNYASSHNVGVLGGSSSATRNRGTSNSSVSSHSSNLSSNFHSRRTKTANQGSTFLSKNSKKDGNNSVETRYD